LRISGEPLVNGGRRETPCFKLCSIGVYGGLGESVGRFSAAPAEEIIERLGIYPLALRGGKRVEDEAFDPLKRGCSRG
jgi:hypothetical protein